MATVNLEAENALSLEIQSLKGALLHYQHVADSASLQLQRRSLDNLERQKQLEAENARLSRELEVLARTPDKSVHPATLSVSELTLAHRRLSERLEITESLLLDKTTELHHATRKAENAVAYAEQCRMAVERVRRAEESAQERARSLEGMLRAAVEEKMMAERAIEDYAQLVRKLANNRSSMSPASPVGSDHRTSGAYNPSLELQSGKAGLQRLVAEFNETADTLHQEISRLHGELDEAKLLLEVERRASEEDRAKLALSRVELDQYIADDRSASKLVERYMKFSQTSIDLLQAALDNQRTRLEARATSSEARSSALEENLAASQAQIIKLRDILDELTENISRESHGRRREVALRLKIVSREEQTVAVLQSLFRRMRDTVERLGPPNDDPALELIAQASSDISRLIDSVNGPANGASPSLLGLELKDTSPQGSLARVISCQETVTSLVAELQIETEKRLSLERKFADLGLQETGLVIQSSMRTPSDLGLGESNETLVDHPIALYPLTPFDRERFPVSASPPRTRGSSPGVEAVHISGPALAITLPDPSPSSRPQTPSPVPKPSEAAVEACPEPTETPKLGPELELPSDSTSSMDLPPPMPSPPPPESPVGPPSEDHHLETTLDFTSLLLALRAVSERHSPTVKALRDCQDSLSLIKRDLQARSTTIGGSLSALRSYVERLSDFLEDARVEVEIRIADDIRLANGYEAMLTLNSASVDEKLIGKLNAFVGGDDPDTARVRESFHRKLDDLEHDIGLLKGAIDGLLPIQTSDEPPSPSSSWQWPGLTNASRSRPSSPVPTFGAVMTQRSPTIATPVPLPTVDTPAQFLTYLTHLPFRIAMPQIALSVPQLVPPNPNRLPTSSLGHKPRQISNSGLSSPMSASRRLSSNFAVGNGRFPGLRTASSGIYLSSPSHSQTNLLLNLSSKDVHTPSVADEKAQDHAAIGLESGSGDEAATSDVE